MRRSSWVAVAILMAAACGTSPAPATSSEPAVSPWAVKVESIPAPPVGHTDSPQLTSSISGIILSWVEHRGGTAYLRFAQRTASGWSDTRTVASGGNWFLSWADVPAVMRLSSGTLVANWYPATDADAEAYDIRLSYSSDAGKSWAKPFGPHSDRTRTQHGFVSMVEMPDTSLGLIWLDGRDQALNKTDPGGGAMGLYFGRYDTAWKQTAEQAIDDRVCECCPTTAVVTADGVLTAFRDRSPREIRDINVARLDTASSAGTWTPARPIHVDNWMIEACPVNGPMLSARGQDVVAAWFTGKDEMPRAYAAFSGDAGRTWSNPIRVDDASTLGHVDVELLDDGSAAVSWMEFANQRSSFRLRRIERSGARSAALEVTPNRVTGYPRISRTGKELLVAWTESVEGDAAEATPEQVKGALVRLP
jgi:hypothetical protein